MGKATRRLDTHQLIQNFTNLAQTKLKSQSPGFDTVCNASTMP
jgi:hypothetical protein